MNAASADLVSRALAAARRSGLEQYVVAGRALHAGDAVHDPLDGLTAACATARFRLERPSAGMALFASGSCAALETAGADRLTRASELLGEQSARTHCADGIRARWIGGFAFAPAVPRSDSIWHAFGSCRFVLPRALWSRDSQGGQLVHAAAIGPADTQATALAALERARREAEAFALAPPRRETQDSAPRSLRLLRPERSYRRLVAAALDAIAKGDADKLVVARAIDCHGSTAPLSRTLRALREANPHCATFALAPGSESDPQEPVFFGATPELLVRLSAGRVEAQALAGSARRGRTAACDSRERSALLASAKERVEHEHVVAALRAALAPQCEALSEPAPPRDLALADLQHLETTVSGRVASARVTALDLAARLHPSPAVAGAPRAASVRWLASHEALERGWYSGAIGWLDANGDGELFVALRCALLRGERARLYAGAGIVSGAQPAAEQRETRLKLRAVFHALREASHARS